MQMSGQSGRRVFNGCGGPKRPKFDLRQEIGDADFELSDIYN
jgi:hypothetical protein